MARLWSNRRPADLMEGDGGGHAGPKRPCGACAGCGNTVTPVEHDCFFFFYIYGQMSKHAEGPSDRSCRGRARFTCHSRTGP